MGVLLKEDIEELKNEFLSNPTINVNKKYRVLNDNGDSERDNLALINVSGENEIFVLTFYPITDDLLEDPNDFYEGDNYDENQEYVVVFNTNSEFNKTIEEMEEPVDMKGGKKKVARKKTLKKRKSLWRGWKKQQPKTKKERTKMWKKCGKKCFLGTKKSYPICTRNTCKINKKGVYSAFIRSRQFKKKNISKKALRILKK